MQVSPRALHCFVRRAWVMCPSLSVSFRALVRVATVTWVYSVMRELIPSPASEGGLWIAALGKPVGSLQHFLVMAAMALSILAMSVSV